MTRLAKFDLKSLSLVQIFAAAMVLLLMVLAAVWMTVAAGVSQLAATSSQLNREIPQLTQSIATIKKFQADHANLSTIAVPNKLNVSQILLQSHHLVTQYGVQLVGLSVQPSQDPTPTAAIADAFAKLSGAANLHAYPIDVTVDGRKSQVMAYIQGLTKGPDFATIISVSLALEKTSEVQAVIAYEVYAENN